MTESGDWQDEEAAMSRERGKSTIAEWVRRWRAARGLPPMPAAGKGILGMNPTMVYFDEGCEPIAPRLDRRRK